MFQKLSFKDLQISKKSSLRSTLGRLKRRVFHHPKVMAYGRGRLPQSRAFASLRKKSRNPETFAEKMWHRLGNDRRPLLTTLSDKYAVREFVKERVGEEYLSKLFGVWEKGRKLNWDLLPKEFVAKTTHGVGGSLIVWYGATLREMDSPKKEDDWRIRLINPINFSASVAERYFSKWVSQRYDRHLPVQPSWSYRNIPAKVIFEEVLTTSRGQIPNDYKFFCFDGKCHLIEVDIDRFGVYFRDFYSPDWKLLDAQLTIPNSKDPIPRPSKLREMIEVAEKLSSGLDFVTVDLYDLEDRIVFGEISFYQGGGHEAFSSRTMEEWLGSLWKLPSRNEMKKRRRLDGLHT